MRINNNILAFLIILVMILSLSMNLILINQANTGISGKTIAVVDLCINEAPMPLFEHCDNNIVALLLYECIVNTTDYYENQPMTFSDNTTLFDIDPNTGEISFAPALFDVGNYSVRITVNDNSGCSNAIASDIWNFTIFSYESTARLETWSDTDNITRYKYDPVRFFANLTSLIDNTTIGGANCTIQFNTTGSYTTAQQMVYNSSAQLYTYNQALGFLQGNHTYRTVCNAIDVGHWINEDINTFNITNRPPYIYAPFPNLTIKQGTTLFGYNLNDYFKDEDLDILSFTHFTAPNINIIISSSGDVTIRPDPWFFGTRTTFFTAYDGFDSVVGNVFTITVEQVVATPGSGGGGGGGMSGPSPPMCIEEWECNEWGPCTPQGFQYRQCVDNNTCYTTKFMPDIVQECEYIGTCYDGIKNCHSGACELGVDCGGPCDPCPTCYDGIQNQGEEGIDCGGPCDPCKEEELRVEEPSQTIVISPELRRTGLSILAILAILGVISIVISFILHKQVMDKLKKLPYPQFSGSIAHVSSESRAVIAIEMAHSDDTLSYNEKISRLSLAFQKLIKVHLKEESSMTLEQIRNRASEIRNDKLAARIISLSQIIEEAEYKEKNELKDIEQIMDPMLSIVHSFIHTKIHEEQIQAASKTSSKLKHSFIKALIDISDSLIMNNRVYSAAILVREALIYYKQIKPSNILRENMENTIKELNKAVQRAREGKNE